MEPPVGPYENLTPLVTGIKVKLGKVSLTLSLSLTHIHTLFLSTLCSHEPKLNFLFSVKMINVVGVVSVVIFYILILAVGMWAARKNSGIEGDQEVKNAFPV